LVGAGCDVGCRLRLHVGEIAPTCRSDRYDIHLHAAPTWEFAGPYQSTPFPDLQTHEFPDGPRPRPVLRSTSMESHCAPPKQRDQQQRQVTAVAQREAAFPINVEAHATSRLVLPQTVVC
jgi:hypothetical protein